tara:strand:+ start:1583 stop:2095 length:513 start_codon:yes stop_codon:yes gene_type:complete
MNQILIVPNSFLRKKTKEVESVNACELDISKKMIDIMLAAPGVGLAANQIGIEKSIITINFHDEQKKKNKIYTLFNPVITKYSKEKVLMEEGCLSIPKQFADIERPESIELKYRDEKNNIIVENKKGYEARILQHEIDHLSGKLFIDYLSSLKRNLILKKIMKLKKKGEI